MCQGRFKAFEYINYVNHVYIVHIYDSRMESVKSDIHNQDNSISLIIKLHGILSMQITGEKIISAV